MPDPLNHRARKILGAIVHEYLATGEAVGSRTVTRRHGIDLSPATVRNVMSDLEEAGLLKQPHTSAGRVPTDSGLRFFVDSLLKVRSLSDKERVELSQRYHIAGDDVESALRDAAHVLAELSSHTAVLVTPRPEIDVLEHVEFVRLRDGQLLAVLVAKSGTVQNKIISSAESLEPEELDRIHNYLNEILAGLTLDEVRARVQKELADERMQYQAMQRKALELSQRALPDAGAEVIVSGQARLLENVAAGDPQQLEKMKALFRRLEEKRLLADLLERTQLAEGIRVFIGAESAIDELSDFTIVAMNYGVEGDSKPLGTLGVIGPTRMNYSKVITLVDFTAQLVSSVIAKR
ncbi:MAG TPA: heat-inducible transcriptional repressor HrcA [Polyangia bacterium]|nr:heat-inducible transcriptional repressor HrcA [Polyangia bacterium]